MNTYRLSGIKPLMIILAVLFCAVITGYGQVGFSEPGVRADLPQISGRIENGILQITYKIPHNRHQVILEDFNFMTLDVKPVPGLEFGETRYPKGDKDKEGNTVYHGTVILEKTVALTGDRTPLPDSIEVEAGYQFCTEDGTCLAPESVQVKVALKAAGALSSGIMADKGADNGLSMILLNLLFAFLGGLILNVMPCVLPVLSIKIMGIVKSAHEDRREILKGSMAYTAGVLLSFLIMGMVIAGLKIAGQSVGWGFQFQNISFVIFLLTIIWVFGLSMFDVFIIQLPGTQAATQASSRSGHWGSFVTGIFAVLLATPCTAPMLGAALGWAFIQPPGMILLSFLIIGLGLAFPFILIGFFPVFTKIIPRPGPWMNTFKEVMAFFLMATVVYLLRVVYFLVDDKVIRILWFLLFIGFACWIIGRYASPSRTKRSRGIAMIAALIISISAGLYFLNFDSTTVTPGKQESGSLMKSDPHHPDWYVFNPDLLDTFRREERPVFIDFAAEWCLTCKTNESTVLFTQEIQDAFAEKQVKLLRGDYTKRNPLLREWLTQFKRAGVPLYVFYLPNQSEPVVLPEVITKEMIHQQLDKIQ